MAKKELQYPLFFNFKFTSHTAMLMHADDVEASDALQQWRKNPENKSVSVPGDDRSPPWTWRTYLYAGFVGANREIVIPQENICAALRYAGSQMTLKGAKTFKKLSVSGIQIQDEFCQLKVALGHDAPFVNEQYFIDTGVPPIKVDEDYVKEQCEGLEIEPGDLHPGFGLRVVTATDIEAIPENLPFRDQVLSARRLGFNLYVKRAPVNKAKHVRVRPRFEVWEVTGRLKVTQEAITPTILDRMFAIAGDQSGLGDWRPSSPQSPGPFGQFSTELEMVA